MDPRRPADSGGSSHGQRRFPGGNSSPAMGRPAPGHCECGREGRRERAGEGRCERADEPQLVTDGGQALDSQFEAIVDQVSEPVFLKDREGRYLYINEAGARLFGATSDEIVGRTDEALFDADAAAEIRADDRRVVESGEPLTVENRRTFDGEERVFRTTKEPYRPNGTVEGVVGVARDVTDQVRTEAERERNERALRALQRLASDRELTFDEKLDRALRIGRDRLDLPVAYLTRIEDGAQTVVAACDETGTTEPGSTVPLEETYCRKTIGGDGLVGVENAGEQGWAGDPAYETFGLECYLGGQLFVGGERYGTLCFASSERRERAFSDSEETFIELLVEWVSYELDRRERAADLERFGTIVRSVDDGVYEVDTDGRFTFVNPAMTELTGYDREELLGEHVGIVKDDEETAAALDALFTGTASEWTVESSLRRKRGPPVPCEDNMTRLDDAEGAVRGAVGVVRDVTEQQAYREMLSELVEFSRSFMGARDREEVAEIVSRAVESILGFELNVVRLFDRDGERLVPAGTTDAVTERLSDPPTYDIEDGGPGQAFIDGVPVEVKDTEDVDDEYDRDVVRFAYHLPMGVHGTISIGTETAEGLSDMDRQAIQLLATSGAAAANRARREQEVRDARERVDTLVDRINGLIENTVEVLVQAGTREELERGVVEQLVATDPYAFAWITQPDFAAETLEASACDGDAPDVDAAVDGRSLDRETDAADPTVRAFEDEEIQILADLADAPEGSVHAAAADAGMGSMVAVPLTYTDGSYGVLTVYTDEPAAIADREQVVLAALGRAVANAVNAIESGRILTANEVIEMEFTVQDAGHLFGRLSAQTGATLELSGSVYQSDGRLRLYVTAAGTDGDAIEDALAGDDAVDDLTVITDHQGEVLFEVTVADALIEVLADYGAVTQSVTAEDGVVRFTVELPYEAEAREVFELVESRYDRTDLVGYHEHERPVQTRQEFREAVFDRFTDRQETAVRTAHLGGFFQWPRDADGDDLAESMDISRPTYHQHLRAAQRKVFEELFDGHAGHRG